MSVSDRLRPGAECAPWVIDEVRRLEAEIKRLQSLLVDRTVNVSMSPSVCGDECRETFYALRNKKTGDFYYEHAENGVVSGEFNEKDVWTESGKDRLLRLKLEYERLRDFEIVRIEKHTVAQFSVVDDPTIDDAGRGETQ